MYQKRTTKRGNYRSVSNLCPNCFSTLSQDSAGAIICSGDRMKAWHEQFAKFNAMSEDEQTQYLSKLDDPDRFIELATSLNGHDCGFSTKISHVAPNQSIRIPDPMAVGRLERTLQRRLTEDELVEEHVFELEGKSYRLPFINFPEDV